MLHHPFRVSRVLTLAVACATFIGFVVPAATAQNTPQYTWTNSEVLGNPPAGVAAVYVQGSTIYAATAGGGLSVSNDNGSTWTNYTTANGLVNNLLWGVYATGSTIYAATNGGLSVSNDNGSTWTNYTTANGLVNDTVYGVYAEGSTIYAATYGGLSVSTDNGSSWTNYTELALGQDGVYNVYAQGNTIYAATGGGGLYILTSDNGKTWVITHKYNNANTSGGFPNDTVNDVFAIGGNIYTAFPEVGADIGGVSVSNDNGSSWSKYTTANGLGSINVNGIYAQLSSIYAATEGGLSVSPDNGSTWVNYTMADGLGSNYVSSVYAIGSTIYAGTAAGVSIGVPKELLFTNYSSSTQPAIASDSVIDVDVRHGVICVATDSGVSTSSGPISDIYQVNWINATTSNGLGSDTVNAVQVAEDFIVAATNGGVSVSTDGGSAWTNATTANGLANDQVFSVYLHDGDIYAATGGGLSISTDQGASWTSPRAILGLPTFDVYVEPSVYQGQVVDVIYVTMDKYPRASFDGGKTFVELTNHCGEKPSPLAGPSIAAQGGTIYVFGSPSYLLADVIQSQACDPSCDYECGWSYVSPWCGYVTDFEVAGPDRWIATPTAGGEEGGLVFNPTGATKSKCPTATQIYTTASGLGSNSVNAVSVGDGLVVAGTTNGVSIAVIGACPGDLNLDGLVDGQDLTRLLSLFGTECGGDAGTCLADLDGSGVIDAGDIAVLLGAWGSCG